MAWQSGTVGFGANSRTLYLSQASLLWRLDDHFCALDGLSLPVLPIPVLEVRIRNDQPVGTRDDHIPICFSC